MLLLRPPALLLALVVCGEELTLHPSTVDGVVTLLR